ERPPPLVPTPASNALKTAIGDDRLTVDPVRALACEKQHDTRQVAGGSQPPRGRPGSSFLLQPLVLRMEPQGIGVDGPAADPVDADAPGSELHGQVADGGLESRLGDPDGSVLRCVATTPDAGNGDDPTAPALHQRYGVLAAQ